MFAKELLTIALACAIGAFSLGARADSSFNPVSDMFISGMERHDFVLVSNAALRCGSLKLIVGQILDRDTNDTEAAAGLTELGGGLSTIGMYTAAAIFKHRGVEIDIENVQQRALDSQDRFTKAYLERMSDNLASDGEMWANDEVIKADLDFCKGLQILFTDEWLETIQSNDWQYWDDLFAE